jgi:hypothetical protein
VISHLTLDPSVHGVGLPNAAAEGVDLPNTMSDNSTDDDDCLTPALVCKKKSCKSGTTISQCSIKLCIKSSLFVDDDDDETTSSLDSQKRGRKRNNQSFNHYCHPQNCYPHVMLHTVVGICCRRQECLSSSSRVLVVVKSVCRPQYGIGFDH